VMEAFTAIVMGFGIIRSLIFMIKSFYEGSVTFKGSEVQGSPKIWVVDL